MTAELAGRTYLITGANTGIGRATAHDLARRGGRVIMANRSRSKSEPVLRAITAETGNADVELLPLDLANLTSVQRAVATLVERDEPIDVLIANAGLAGQQGVTAQGFELAFGTNHLGHFLFVTELLDLVRRNGQGRVVVVASDSHTSPKGIDFDAVQHPTVTTTGMREYGVSKLANVLFAQELARRVPEEELLVRSLHPGVIASDVWRRVPWPVRPVMKLFMRSVEQGAQTTLHCATAEHVGGPNGCYMVKRRPKDPSPVATPQLAAELWRRSEEWVAPYRRSA